MDPQTVQAVNEAFKQLNDPNEVLRADAAAKLGELGVTHPRLVEKLRDLAHNDPIESVRAAAAQALAVLENKKPEREEPQAAIAAPAAGPSVAVPQPVAYHPAIQDEAVIALLQRQTQILETIQAHLVFSSELQKEDQYNLRTHVTDIDMSIGAMMSFMLKWLVASIPVGIILLVVWFFIFGLIGFGR